jgi:hypothetical protein
MGISEPKKERKFTSDLDSFTPLVVAKAARAEVLKDQKGGTKSKPPPELGLAASNGATEQNG